MRKHRLFGAFDLVAVEVGTPEPWARGVETYFHGSIARRRERDDLGKYCVYVEELLRFRPPSEPPLRWEIWGIDKHYDVWSKLPQTLYKVWDGARWTDPQIKRIEWRCPFCEDENRVSLWYTDEFGELCPTCRQRPDWYFLPEPESAEADAIDERVLQRLSDL